MRISLNSHSFKKEEGIYMYNTRNKIRKAYIFIVQGKRCITFYEYLSINFYRNIKSVFLSRFLYVPFIR